MTKRYPSVVANDGVSLTVAPGEIHAVLGENGAGKSTLMKIIFGAVQPDAGEMLLDGQPVTIANPHQARALGIAMVFQHFSLFDTLTVAENILLGLPAGVYPVAGLTVGWPVFRRPVSMRLPQSVVVHQERYDDSNLAPDVAAYDDRRRARDPKAPSGLKNIDVYPPREGVGWSEDVARQLSVPERFGFATYLKTKGFDLA